MVTNPNAWSWIIAGLATAGVILRPFQWPEAVWAVGGALLLVALGLMPGAEAWHAVGEGSNVYLFLSGMLLLSEVGRSEGLFDWAAVLAVNHSRGSPQRLFALVYAVGVMITVFLSNDAAAVVLTPAVLLAARKAKTEALPLLFVCAFVANAASFVLPISNPANLVLYANHTPALGDWLLRFTLPSMVSIGTTFVLLRWTQRSALGSHCATNLTQTPLTSSGWIALAGIAVTAVVLSVVSANDQPLGPPTAVLGVMTAIAVMIRQRRSPWAMAKDIAWSVLPLVAGLFVLVEALDRTGVIGKLAVVLKSHALADQSLTALSAGIVAAFSSNLVNNLPAGLIASSTLLQAHVGERVTDALLIGVDLGPNLSITGSLATILWLNAIRREGENVGFMRFLKVGMIVMPPTLLLTLAARLLTH